MHQQAYLISESPNTISKMFIPKKIIAKNPEEEKILREKLSDLNAIIERIEGTTSVQLSNPTGISVQIEPIYGEITSIRFYHPSVGGSAAFLRYVAANSSSINALGIELRRTLQYYDIFCKSQSSPEKAM